MSQLTSPFLDAKYGWNLGESGWNLGMDENLLKFSFMFTGTIDAIVEVLPTATNGSAYFLTTDSKLYFAVGSLYYSCPTPKWFVFNIRTTGASYRFNGTSAVAVPNSEEVAASIAGIEATLATLGTAAFEDVSFFATPADVAAAVAAINAADVTFNSYTGVTRTTESKLKDSYSAKDFGAVEDTTGVSIVANETALNLAMSVLSAAGVANGKIITLELDGHYIVGSTLQGANKAILPPKSNVRVVNGTLKIKNSAATGWNLIYPAADTDAAVYNFSVENVIFNGNGPNNLNLTLQRNAMIGVLTGTDIVIRKNTFVDCPGFHITTFGRDLFPQTVTRVLVEGNTVHNVASAIPGNTGITDHSSFYMLGTECTVRNNYLFNDTEDTIGTAIELHGDNSSATGNYYRNYLNLVNLGGYISNASNIRISDNIGANVEMCVRNYTKAGFVVDNVVVANNQLTVRTTSLSQFDFGGAAVENLLTGNVRFENNFVSYIGADTVSPPPVFWIRGIKNVQIVGNTVKECNGWPVLISNPAIDAVISIKGNNFDHPNNTATVSYASAVYIDATTGTWKILDISNNTVRAARQYLLEASAGATGGPIRVVNNTVSETSDLVSIPTTTGFTAGSVYIQHSGDVPAAGQFSTNYVKFAIGSVIQGLAGELWKFKQAPGNGLWNKEIFTTTIPTTGTYFIGDIAFNVTATEQGTTPNKYLIECWRRITSGSGHVLNTDWLQVRSLTGN